MIKNSRIKRLAIATIIVNILMCTCLFVLHGPWSGFRSFWITTAMTTSRHKYLASIFYSEDTIKRVLKENVVVVSKENTDVSLIHQNGDLSNNYQDELDKQILTRNKGNNLYKVINIKGKGYRGFLVAVYDPSKIKLVMADDPYERGDYLTNFAKIYNAKVVINASGFYDLAAGGVPVGSVIKDGKIVISGSKTKLNGGLIGFDYNNNLVLTKDNVNTAITKYNLRDAVEFGPFLIVNGKESSVKGNGGWGIAPRTVIGQRRDGIVLLLIIDGRRPGYSMGADMPELAKIMIDYKAVNAANLDGGLSSTLVINKKIWNKPAVLSSEQRPLPNAWIVTSD